MPDGFIYLIMDKDTPDNLVMTVSKKNEIDMRTILKRDNQSLILIYYKYFSSIKTATTIIKDLIKSRAGKEIEFEIYSQLPVNIAIDSMVLSASILEKTDELQKRKTISENQVHKTLAEIEPTKNSKPLFDEIDEYIVIEGNIDLLESMEIAIETPSRFPEIIDLNIRAARMGNKYAFDNLGFLYSSGLNEEFTDFQKALVCFNIAVDLGYMDSLISIAELYEELGDLESSNQKWHQYLQHVRKSISLGSEKRERHTSGVAQYIINRMENYKPIEFKDVINYMFKNSNLQNKLNKMLEEIEATSGKETVIKMKETMLLNKLSI